MRETTTTTTPHTMCGLLSVVLSCWTPKPPFPHLVQNRSLERHSGKLSVESALPICRHQDDGSVADVRVSDLVSRARQRGRDEATGDERRFEERCASLSLSNANEPKDTPTLLCWMPNIFFLSKDLTASKPSRHETFD